MLLAALLSTLAFGYAQHVTVARSAALASWGTLAAQESCQSALDYGRHAALNGAPVVTSPDGGLTTVSVSSVGPDRSTVLARTVLPEGTGLTRLLEVELLPAPTRTPADPDDLPRLSSPTVTALMADPAVTKTWITGDTLLANTDVSGLLIVSNGARLRVDNVVLEGSIVSQRMLGTALLGPFAVGTAPELVLEGSLRIEPGSFLPGLAVLMPDGVVSTAGGDGRVQLAGDVVAHGLQLGFAGVIHGHVLSVTNPVLASGLDLPGEARAPLPWASNLVPPDSWDTSFVGVVADAPALLDVSAITGYWSP